MTFDAAVSTDWGTAVAAIRDNVSGMANWSLADTSANGDQTPVPMGEWFVLQTPTGEYIKLDNPGSGGRPALRAEYGPDWDAANDTWADQYENGTFVNDSRYVGIILNSWTGSDNTDAVTYWMDYVDGEGFGFYCQREVGDGQDGSFGFSFSKITELWDYDAADQRASDYMATFGGHRGDDSGSSVDSDNYRTYVDGATLDYGARGVLNADPNFANYPWNDAVIRHKRIQNADGQAPIIGYVEPPMMIHDVSGADTAHRDTVQDSGGANVYTILKRGPGELALRMD